MTTRKLRIVFGLALAAAALASVSVRAASNNPLDPDYYVGQPSSTSAAPSDSTAGLAADSAPAPADKTARARAVSRSQTEVVNPEDPSYYVGHPVEHAFVGTSRHREAPVTDPLDPAYQHM